MDDRNALIVDDEADIRELIEMTLLPLGVTCLPAETLSMARALLKRQPLSFCITDLRLPDGNGLELVAHIQKHYPNLPVAVDVYKRQRPDSSDRSDRRPGSCWSAPP